MKIKILLLVVIIATSSILHGQTDFRTGYIIQNNGDTTYGEIDYRGDFLMSKTCKFKNPGNIVTEYSPYDINAFRFIGGKYYKSKEVNNTKIFLEFLIKGKINIYYAWFERKEHYFLEKDSLQLVEIPYEEVVKEIDNRRYLKQSTQHVGFLTYYMQDAPSIQSSIQKLDKPEHVGLIKLAEEYHNAVCKDEKCVIYEKKPPFFKVNVETVAGMVKYMDDEVLKDKYYFQGGVMAHLWLLRTNEKIYLKTGMLYSQVEKAEGLTANYYTIPLHIAYMAPETYVVRPSFSIGLVSPSYSVGTTVKLGQNVSLGMQAWLNCHAIYIPLIPAEIYNYSFLGSLYFEL